MDFKLELVAVPVSDVDRAKAFYTEQAGFNADHDHTVSDEIRFVQLTPPGSACSIALGSGIIDSEPGSVQGLQLVVSDIEAARAELVGRGIDVSEVFHRAGPGKPPLSGLEPTRRSYASFATFSDPDGNSWLVQEITARLPGRINAPETTFTSSNDLASALRRAEAAHGEHEKRTGERDENWPDWYAEYIVSEQGGKPLPS